MPSLPRAAAAVAAAVAAGATLAAAALPGDAAPWVFPNAAGIGPFSAARFGLFIHWGPISQWGDEISFPLVCTAFPCTVQAANRSSLVINNAAELAAHRQAYHDLALTFNPTAFNATALAQLAWAAGFRYVTPTIQHCDGFSLYASAINAGYSMSITPYGRVRWSHCAIAAPCDAARFALAPPAGHLR